MISFWTFKLLCFVIHILYRTVPYVIFKHMYYLEINSLYLVLHWCVRLHKIFFLNCHVFYYKCYKRNRTVSHDYFYLTTVLTPHLYLIVHLSTNTFSYYSLSHIFLFHLYDVWIWKSTFTKLTYKFIRFFIWKCSSNIFQTSSSF